MRIVWKFHDFSIAQILRETEFEDSSSAKSQTITHLEAVNLDFYEFLHLLEVEIDQMNKIQNPKNGRNGSFRHSRFFKIDFT